MKNTVKKILALVFVVAMVCSLAVPAFAADETIEVNVYVYGRDGKVIVGGAEVELTGAKNQTVEKALEAQVIGGKVTVSSTTGKLTAVQTGTDATTGAAILDKNTDKAVLGEFGTGAYVVALNGKIVAEDLGNVAIANGDEIVVYYNDSTFPTTLAQYDDSNIEAGIISFYSYDAAGNKKPLVGATVTLNVENLLVVSGTVTAASGETLPAIDANGMPYKNEYGTQFTTDEKGQIWVAPQFLGKGTITISKVEWKATELKQGDMSKKEFEHYKRIYAVSNLFEADQLAGSTIVVDDMYNVAGATGDMTVVYVMVAAAAVITLGAVVIMKKKAVKAN